MKGTLALVWLLAAASCGGGAPATVTGEVFVVLATGAEVETVGAPVHLLDYAERADTALARLCASRRDLLAGVEADSAREAISERAWEARARLLRSLSRESARTVPGGRFRMDSVAPAEYRLWTDLVVQGERWSWTEPVAPGGGDSVHVVLGNANADADPFRCQLLRRMEEDAA